MKKTRSTWKRLLGTVVGEKDLDLAFWKSTNGGIGGVRFNSVGRIADICVGNVVGLSGALVEKTRAISL